MVLVFTQLLNFPDSLVRWIDVFRIILTPNFRWHGSKLDNLSERPEMDGLCWFFFLRKLINELLREILVSVMKYTCARYSVLLRMALCFTSFGGNGNEFFMLQSYL